jgi:magnesium chelatase family protein
VLESVAPLAEDAKALMNQAVERGKLSARAYYRILRVARTIADLAGGGDILGRAAVAEALSYRRIFLNSL